MHRWCGAYGGSHNKLTQGRTSVAVRVLGAPSGRALPTNVSLIYANRRE